LKLQTLNLAKFSQIVFELTITLNGCGILGSRRKFYKLGLNRCIALTYITSMNKASMS